MSRSVRLTVNGRALTVHVEDHHVLLDVLRDQLRLFSVREGCGVGTCGACTVLLDGAPLSSCLLLAARLDGRTIVTVEGLGSEQALHPVQQAFLDAGALQCGYCTPGLVLSVVALLRETPAPSPADARAHLSGNLCRCGAYPDILRAVDLAREALADQRAERARDRVTDATG